MENSRQYCSELARAAASPLFGTAIRVDCWLLVEYSRPWRPKAIEDNELDTAINEHLAGLVDEFAQQHDQTLRVQFIKQAASDSRAPRVYCAHPAAVGASDRVLFDRELAGYDDLVSLSAEELLACAGWHVNEREMYFVCTNGQRDVCCARFGLPVYEALRMHVDARAWQTTHVGGHRYAPNVLCLPSGVMYGHVTPENVVELVTGHDRGVLGLDSLRGFCHLTELEQTADYLLRAAGGYTDTRPLAYEISAEGPQGPWRVQATATLDGTVTLRLDEYAEAGMASCGKAAQPIARYRPVAAG